MRAELFNENKFQLLFRPGLFHSVHKHRRELFRPIIEYKYSISSSRPARSEKLIHQRGQKSHYDCLVRPNERWLKCNETATNRPELRLSFRVIQFWLNADDTSHQWDSL